MGAAFALTIATLVCCARPMASPARIPHALLARVAQHGATAASQPNKAKDAPPKAPPLKPIAGLRGFDSESTVVYAAMPNSPHRLRATYVFPERARWYIGALDEKSPERRLQYRFGEQLFQIEPRTAESHELTDVARDDVLRHMELRRALMLWPDGFAWKGTGADRKADLGALGSLRAHFAKASDPRPIEISDFDHDGKEIDALKALTWRDERGRSWPASAELWHAGALIWKETIDKIDTSTQFVDAFFLPADRRDDKPTTNAPPARVESLELPAFCGQRVELPTACTWEHALAEFARVRSARSEELRGPGLEIEPMATFEVAADMHPTAFILRLTSNPSPPPSGFDTTPARKGFGMQVAGLAQATPALLISIRGAAAKAKKDAPARSPYVRFLPQDPPAQVLVVLPVD